MSEVVIDKTRDQWGLWPAWKLVLRVGDDEDASRRWGLEKTMRIGECIVRFGGIAAVETRREHRLKGFASRVIDASNGHMAERGCDMGILFGIGDFSHRFGYGLVLPVSW